MLKSKILFIMTGSIACYKACNIISKLVQNNFEVQVVASNSAMTFIGPSTLEGLTGRPALTSIHQQGYTMDHIHLERWADAIIVAPATANYINKMASGICDDLPSTIFLAHQFNKPFLVAPAMNTSMYLHPITQQSLSTLKKMDIHILETSSGVLACGESGEGKLLDTDLIYNEILFSLKITTGQKRKVLVTAGGTSEKIDSVRVLTNTSSGQTGLSIAKFLTSKGYDVTFLKSENSPSSSVIDKEKIFSDFYSLQKQMKEMLTHEHFDALIHTAAVSDYSVESIAPEGQQLLLETQNKKISSESERVTLTLKKNPKIINSVREYSLNKKIKIFSFKLTATNNTDEHLRAVKKLFEQSQSDVVIHNDQLEIEKGNHLFRLHRTDLSSTKTDKNFLGSEIEKLMELL